MADFKQAVKWLKEGKKVTRNTLHIDSNGFHFKLEGSDLMCCDNEQIKHATVHTNNDWGLLLNDVLECDWQPYEEPFKITETGLYKNRFGTKVYIADVAMETCYGMIEACTVPIRWDRNGKVDKPNYDKSCDIVSKWED